MGKIVSKRIGAGNYKVFDIDDPSRYVDLVITEQHDGMMWVAVPSFDTNTSDPESTKREVMKSAVYFLTEYVEDLRKVREAGARF